MAINQIGHAVETRRTSQLVTCKRCGCEKLAWVQNASGKWYLAQTYTARPWWRGDGPAPEALPGTVFVLKPAAHRCEEWIAAQIKLHNEDRIPSVEGQQILVRAIINIGQDTRSNPWKQKPVDAGDIAAMDILVRVAAGQYQQPPAGERR